MINEAKKALVTKKKTNCDDQFPEITESQMKLVCEGGKGFAFNKEDDENGFDFSSEKAPLENNLSSNKEERNPQANWVIERNQCCVKYSPYGKCAIKEDKNQIMKSICHGLIDMFFGQKEEIDSLKYEIQNLGKIIKESQIHQSPHSKRKSHSIEIARDLSMVKSAELNLHLSKDEQRPSRSSLSYNSRQIEMKKVPESKPLPKSTSNTFRETNKINDDQKEKEEIVSLSTIIDDEFDNMMTSLKQKKSSIPLKDNPFKKSLTFLEREDALAMKNASGKLNQTTEASFQSDFLCGGKPTSFQPNEKTRKLLKEMENEPGVFDEIGGSEKTTKEIAISKKKNRKRNYNESTITDIHLSPKMDKRKQFKNGSKMEKPTKDKSLVKPQRKTKPLNIRTITQCTYMCLCEGSTSHCYICNGAKIVNLANFHKGFYESQAYKDAHLDDLIIKQSVMGIQDGKIEKGRAFFKYQYRLLSWKQYVKSFLQSKTKPNHFSKQILNSVYAKLVKKYSHIFVKGKRSFLMKVCEKDASINSNMVLLIFNITFNKKNKNYTLELSDGFKSVYATIEPSNPIRYLIERKELFLGMKLNIGLAKVNRITADFEVFISIFYNSVAPAEWNEKLGRVKKRKYVIKNLANILGDGGDISMINVVILKKYDYYVTDFDTKESYSKTKYDKMLQDSCDNELPEVEAFQTRPKALTETAKQPINKINVITGNLLYHFRVICVDALLYYDYMSNITKYRSSYSPLVNCLLKRKLFGRKCTIDFSIKNIALFEEFQLGRIYCLMLLKMARERRVPYNTIAFSEIKLTANDSIRFIEEHLPPDFKKDKQYQSMLSHLATNVMKERIEACEFFLKEHYNNDYMLNEEFCFWGCYLNKVKISTEKVKEENKEICYLMFWSYTAMIVLIKIHHMKYFDIETFLQLKKGYKAFEWENVTFEQVCSYDKDKNMLLPVKADKDKKGINNLVLCLETNYYSNYKPIHAREDARELIKKIETDKPFNTEIIDRIAALL